MKIAGFDFKELKKLGNSDDKENSKKGFLAVAVLGGCVGYFIYGLVKFIIGVF